MSTSSGKTNEAPRTSSFMDKLTDTDWLEQQRYKSDPIADEVIAKIIEGGSLDSVNLIFDHVMKNQEIPSDEMPDALRNYFEETAALPAWANKGLIREGEKFFQEHGSQICMMLLCKSLPTMYACRKGAKVLGMSGRFMEKAGGDMKSFNRRLMETAQFLIDIMGPNGLGADGHGIRTAQKVRLIHAAIRYYLTERHQWNTDEFGIPINQLDLTTTLMSFSVWPLEGLEQIGIDTTPQQREAFMHVWRVVGHILGINADLIPANFAEGKAWADTVLNREKGASEEGEKLTAGCITFLEYIIPGTVFDFFPKRYVRFLIGDELADMLGVERHENISARLLEKGFRFITDKWDDYKDQSTIMRKLSVRFNMAFLEGMVLYFNDYKEATLYIPPSLKENWEKSARGSGWHDVVHSPSAGNWRVSLQHRSG